VEENIFLGLFVFLLLLFFFFLLDFLFANSEDVDAFISHTLSPSSVPLSFLFPQGVMVSRTSIALVTSFTWGENRKSKHQLRSPEPERLGWVCMMLQLRFLPALGRKSLLMPSTLGQE